MSLKKTYLGIKKLDKGPGGWHCSCCNPYRCSVRKMKARARRLTRRISRHELINQLQSVEV